MSFTFRLLIANLLSSIIAMSSVVAADAATGPFGRIRPFVAAPAIKFTQFGGRAQSVVPSPDGTLWALSLQPAGAAKHILHYVNGSWTQMPGFATEISISSNGTPFFDDAVTGGLYAYNGSTLVPQTTSQQPVVWVGAGANSSFYAVLKQSNSSGNYPIIYKQPGSSSVSLPNVGVQVAAVADPNTYSAIGIGDQVGPNGYFALESDGTIDYCQKNSYKQCDNALPLKASEITPVTGGFFALQYPMTSSGSQLYYFDYQSDTVTTEPYRFTNLSTLSSGNGTEKLFAVDSNGIIWSTAFTPTVPQPIVALFPAKVASGYSDITMGPDGNLWFTDFGDGAIGRMTPTGQATYFQIPTAKSKPIGIASGPDGALWFTEGIGKVGRITTNGIITEYRTSVGGGHGFIATGADGALWFEDRGIGRITTDGTYSEIPITGGSGPVALGPDGDIWFGQFGEIGKVTTQGVITEYPIGSAEFTVLQIAVGPNGAMWFTDTADMCEITTSGTLTQYQSQNSDGDNVGPYNGIARGRDGALWFTEVRKNNIGQITTNGTYTEFPPFAAVGPDKLTNGPTGSLWFTANNAIGRVTFQ